MGRVGRAGVGMTTTTAHVCDLRTDGAGSVYYVARAACPACHPAPEAEAEAADLMTEAMTYNRRTGQWDVIR